MYYWFDSFIIQKTKNKKNLKDYHFLRSFFLNFLSCQYQKQKQLKFTQHALYIMIYELLTQKM